MIDKYPNDVLWNATAGNVNYFCGDRVVLRKTFNQTVPQAARAAFDPRQLRWRYAEFCRGVPQSVALLFPKLT